MKIIDEKGKLFGKLNIIDLLVLVLVAAVALFVGARFLGDNSTPGISSGPVYLEYTVFSPEVHPETYEVVKQFVDAEKGLKDQLMASDALLSGYVVDVTATPHVTYVQRDDGTIVVTESSGEDDRLDLTFTCVAISYDPVSNEVGTQDIRAGIPQHIVKTTHFEIRDSDIISVKWLDEAPF